jgi:RNA polymerase-binding protein DksA
MSHEELSMPLTEQQIESFRTRLQEERRRILHNIEALHEELGTSLSDGTEENGLESHLGDVATVTFLRERDLSIEEHEEHILNEIDAALKRVADGTYGVCIESGKDIPVERLEALPWASRLVELEEARGH